MEYRNEMMKLIEKMERDYKKLEEELKRCRATNSKVVAENNALKNSNKRLKRELAEKEEAHKAALAEKEEKKQAPSNKKKVYAVYIQYAGRLMKVGEYSTKAKAEYAEKQASKALA